MTKRRIASAGPCWYMSRGIPMGSGGDASARLSAASWAGGGVATRPADGIAAAGPGGSGTTGSPGSDDGTGVDASDAGLPGRIFQRGSFNDATSPGPTVTRRAQPELDSSDAISPTHFARARFIERPPTDRPRAARGLHQALEAAPSARPP